MEHSLYVRVLAFVSEELGVHPQKLSLNTSLDHDLGVGGDDAVEFFEAFVREFGVDPRSFPAAFFEQYFGHEGMTFGEGLIGCVALPWAFLCLIIPYLPNPCARPELEDRVLVQDLLEAAVAKRWVKP
jgi:hypothetical protein